MILNDYWPPQRAQEDDQLTSETTCVCCGKTFGYDGWGGDLKTGETVLRYDRWDEDDHRLYFHRRCAGDLVHCLSRDLYEVAAVDEANQKFGDEVPNFRELGVKLDPSDHS